MSQITCEICGGSDFVKQNDMFVCESCGMKYTAEEIRKLIGNETKTDNAEHTNDSAKMENLYTRARKSLEVDDLEHAAEYYKEILDERPDDWEAYFYSYLGENMSFTNAKAGEVAMKLGKTIPSAYDMAIKAGSIEEKEDRIKEITSKTVLRLSSIASTAQSLINQYEGGNPLGAKGRVLNQMYNQLRPIVQNTILCSAFAFDPLIEKLEEISNEDNGISQLVCNDCIINMQKTKYNISKLTFSPSAGVTETLIKEEVIREMSQKIEQLEEKTQVLRKKSVDDYWAAHPQERADLETKKIEAEAKITELEKSVEELSESIKRKELMDKIADSHKQMDSLGLFKSKEKKAIQSKIYEMRAALKNYDAVYNEKRKEIEPELERLQETIKNIDCELTKDR